MGLFGHNCDSWRDYGAPAGGTQQQVCKHGTIRTIRIKAGLFHTHSYPTGRRGSIVECWCSHQKRI